MPRLSRRKENTKHTDFNVNDFVNIFWGSLIFFIDSPLRLFLGVSCSRSRIFLMIIHLRCPSVALGSGRDQFHDKEQYGTVPNSGAWPD